MLFLFSFFFLPAAHPHRIASSLIFLIPGSGLISVPSGSGSGSGSEKRLYPLFSSSPDAPLLCRGTRT